MGENISFMDQNIQQHKPTYKIARNGLEILLKVLGPMEEAPPRYKDAVLIAIDFENNIHFNGDLSRNVNTQLGLAILDTRDISSTALAPEKLISTYNFVTGSPEYYRKSMLKSLFGMPILIKLSEVIDQLRALIPKDRNVILVGHDIRNDVYILLRLGFDLRGLECLDTFRIAGEVLPYFSLRLGELLTELGCPHNWLHNGGNDAHFTLRALLLLAVKASLNQVQGNAKLALLEDLALSPMPSISPGEEELVAQEKAAAAQKRALKLAKRYKNTRKYQSRFWSAEQQAEIRAERAARRLAKAESFLEHNDYQ
jgi:hypothetical protein